MMTSIYSCGNNAIPTLLHLVLVRAVCTFIICITTVVHYDCLSFNCRDHVTIRRTFIGNNFIILNPIVYHSHARTIQPTQLKIYKNDNEDQDDNISYEEEDAIMNVLFTKIDEELLELGMKLMPNNKEMEDQHEIARLCSKAFQNITKIDPKNFTSTCIEEEKDTKKSNVPSSTTKDGNVRDESFNLEDLCLYLDKVQNWDKLSVSITTNSKSRIILDKYEWEEGLLSLKKLKDLDISLITLTNQKVDNKCITVKDKPWKLSKLQDFLSEFDPIMFPLVDRTKQLLKELDNMFNNDVGKSTKKDEYIPGLVDTIPSLGSARSLYEESDKSQVLVIAGDSGSGKSVCATYGLQHEIRGNDYAFLYYSIGDETYVGDANTTPRSPMKVAIEYMMNWMNTNNLATSRLYKYLSQSNRKLNTARNELAANSFRNIWTKKMKSNITKEWWNCDKTPSSLTLNGIVIILDEVGKDMQFAYGVVEEARYLLAELLNSQKAKKGKIVIVGAGLDDFPFKKSSSLSTDPTLSKVIVMQTPNKDVLNTKFDLSQKDLDGTYASVLSDNARMLMLGVVPILKSEFWTNKYQDSSRNGGLIANDKRTNDRILAGSFGPLMNYAIRTYVQKNGLSRLSPGDLENTLLALFQLCLQRSLEKVINNHIYLSDAASKAKNFLPNLVAGRENELIKYGLLPATPTKFSSNAIKFLACDGNCVPVYHGNGFIFEDLVEMHLNRLHSLDLKHIILTFKLLEAWPPKTNKNTYEKLKRKQAIDLSIFDDNHKSEIMNLRKVINSAGSKRGLMVSVIMRQSVTNAQGPDIFVLSLTFDNNTNSVSSGTLDIFQAKNVKSLRKIQCGCYSLGMVMPYDDSTWGKESAEYTNKSMVDMVAQLNEHLGSGIEIRKRCLVIRQSAEDVKEESNVEAFVRSGIVDLWTSDFLEPTFSAIPITKSESDDFASSFE